MDEWFPGLRLPPIWPNPAQLSGLWETKDWMGTLPSAPPMAALATL